MKWQWAILVSTLVGCGDDIATTGLSTGTATASGTPTTGAPTTGAPTTVAPTTGASTAAGSTATTGDEPPGTTTGSTGSTDVATVGTSTTTGDDPSSIGSSSESGTDTSSEPLRCPDVAPDPPLAECEFAPPPAAFTPVLQWSFTPDDGNEYSASTPLVGDLTDDNGDGVIDLHDTPDVVLLAHATNPDHPAALYVLDGATGALHFKIADAHWGAVPALGDIDGDGLMEILVQDRSARRVVAYEHDGAFKWRSDALIPYHEHAGAPLVLADVDNDCDVELVFADTLLDHHGQLLTDFLPDPYAHERAPAAHDIDGDGDLEILLHRGVYHHDGAPLFVLPEWDTHVGIPEVADFDGDGRPEVLFSTQFGLTMMEHDGSVKFHDLMPLALEEGAYLAPSAILDLDHDGAPEFIKTSIFRLNTFRGDAAVHWSAPVGEPSWGCAPTLFDFLGDGTPEIVHANEFSVSVRDHTGAVVWEEPHACNGSETYPVVADIDGDGAAELLLTSRADLAWFHGEPNPFPTLRAFRDQDDRWAPARRIYNQQSYHVTNVRDDGTIPQFEAPHWQGLGSVHVQAHVGPTGVCKPPG